VAQAGQQYLAAVAPLNTALNGFQVALNKASGQGCSCPAGEFNATAAILLIPSIDGDLQAVETALQRIKAELPRISADVDAVVADDQRELTYFAAAFQAAHQNDAAGLSTNIVGVAFEQQSAAPDITRLRADVGLPPPAGSGSGSNHQVPVSYGRRGAAPLK
jgi:hypothetical protein